MEEKKFPRCAICGSNVHAYKHHYPPPSQRLYDSLREKWENFLNRKEYNICDYEDYADFVDDFCEEEGYGEGLKEMAFFDLWWDTFADEFFKKVEENEYDESQLMVCEKCGFKTDSKFVMERHACHPKEAKANI